VTKNSAEYLFGKKNYGNLTKIVQGVYLGIFKVRKIL
jgi:hypothetical protein